MTRTTGEMPLWTWRLTKTSWRSSMLAPCRVSASTLHASRSPTASTATCRGHWIPGTLLLLERIESGVPLLRQQHAGVSGSQVRSYCWREYSQEFHCFDSNMQGSLDPRYALIVGENSVRSPTASTATCRGLWIPGTLLLLERIQSGVLLHRQQHARISGVIIMILVKEFLVPHPGWAQDTCKKLEQKKSEDPR